MIALLLFLFIAIPTLECFLLVVLADWAGWQITFLIVIATGVVGSFLARTQGFRVWGRIQSQMQAGQMPTDALLDGVMILVAGVLLITPGVLTDIFGLSLLVPPCRNFYRWAIKRWFGRNFQVQSFTSGEASQFNGGQSEVIDSYVVDRHTDE